MDPRVLYNAASDGKLGLVRRLVRGGADVDWADEEGRTPLFVTAGKGHAAVVRCLGKELGAAVNQANNEGTTPLWVAAENGHLSVVRCLGKELGAAVNQACEDGETPLYVAAEHGRMDVVRYLVTDLHAAVNQAKNNGDSPVGIAAANGHDEVAQFLTRHGADIRAEPALGTAADRAAPELAAWLKTRYCANPGCDQSAPKKCTKCQKVFYCCQACLLAHWPTHKVACRADRKRRAR